MLILGSPRFITTILSKLIIVIILFALFISSGCTLKKPYVGMQFDTTDWPKYESGKTRIINTDAFIFELKITETGNDGEYILEGNLDGNRGAVKSFNHLVISQCHFSIILSKDNEVVDNLYFFPRGNDHRQKLPFSRTFKTVPFDSFIVSYNVAVRG